MDAAGIRTDGQGATTRPAALVTKTSRRAVLDDAFAALLSRSGVTSNAEQAQPQAGDAVAGPAVLTDNGPLTSTLPATGSVAAGAMLAEALLKAADTLRASVAEDQGDAASAKAGAAQAGVRLHKSHTPKDPLSGPHQRDHRNDAEARPSGPQPDAIAQVLCTNDASGAGSTAVDGLVEGAHTLNIVKGPEHVQAGAVNVPAISKEMITSVAKAKVGDSPAAASHAIEAGFDAEQGRQSTVPGNAGPMIAAAGSTNAAPQPAVGAIVAGTAHALQSLPSTLPIAQMGLASVGQTGTLHEPAVAPHYGSEILSIHSVEAAGPDKLEIALANGTSGTLTVRTQIGQDGTVHALLRGAGDAATALRAQKTELTEFLSANAVTVSRIDIEALPIAPIQRTAPSGDALHSAAEHGGSQDGRQQRSPFKAPTQDAMDREQRASSERSVRRLSSAVPLYGLTLARAGGWLSVRA